MNSARFAPDGHTVVYSAVWDSGRSEVYSRRIDSPEALPLGHPSADLLAISPTSELALALDSRLLQDVHSWAGTLATVPLQAGTPRGQERDIAFADWTPDGRDLAIVRQSGGGDELQLPRGKVLYASAGRIYCARLSPAADRVAFIESLDGVMSAVVVVDRSGKKTVLADQFRRGLPSGMAWSPSGDEVWFGAIRSGITQEVHAVTLSGRRRLVYRESGSIRLLDVTRDGRVLVSRDRPGGRAFFRGQGDSVDRELGWLDDSYLTGLTADGRRVLLVEQGDGAGPEGSDLYVRETDGKPPMKLGPGDTYGFWGGDRFVASVGAAPPDIVLYPVPSGPPEKIAVKGVAISLVAGILPPDNRAVAFTGSEPSRPPRIWVVDRDGSKLRAISPEGVHALYGLAVPPDGASVIGTSETAFQGRAAAYPVAGGEPRVVEGLLEGEQIAGWTADGRGLYAYRANELPWKVVRVDPRTGARALVREIVPADRSGRMFVAYLFVTPDAKTYAYTTCRWQSELHLIGGLK